MARRGRRGAVDLVGVEIQRSAMINEMTAQIGTQLDDDLALALGLATEAGALGLAHFVAGVVAEMKADASPVTVADREVEHLLRRQLAASRPADSILGEEFGMSGNAARTWILDPIDGTNFFAERDPNWRVQIALQVNDEIVLAVVDEPANGRRWWASLGGGTWEQARDGEPRRLRTSDRRADPPTVAVYPQSIEERLPAHQLPQMRSPLPLVDVIRGDLDAFFVDCCQVWDHAPWVLLVEEAGGRFTDHDGGRRPDRRGGLYSGAAIHDELFAGIRRR
jgi:histidinol-phosphatase